MKKKKVLLDEKGASLLIWLVVLLVLAAGGTAAFLFLNKSQAPEPTKVEARTKIKKMPITPPPKQRAAGEPTPLPESAPASASSAEGEASAPSEAPAQEIAQPPAAGEAVEGDESPSATDSPSEAAKPSTSASTVKAAAETSASSLNRPDETTMRKRPEKTEAATVKTEQPTIVQAKTITPPPAATPIQPSKLAPTIQKAAAPAPTPAPEAVVADQPRMAAVATPAPVEKAAAMDKAPAEPAPFTVQLGAFHSEVYANDLLAQLVERGYSAFIVTRLDASNRMMYLVRCGHYTTRDEAMNSVNNFKEKEKLDAAVALTLAR